MFFADVFDAEVVNDEAESDWARFVAPEAGCVSAGMVAVLAEVINELVVGDAACLGQAIHAAAYFGIDVAVDDFVGKIEGIDDFLWENINGDADVLVVGKGCVEVEILDIDSKWIKAKEVIPHPNYNDYAGFPYTYDVGLVILNKPINMDTYGELPPPGFLEGILNGNNADNVFTNVGYGVQGGINPFYADDYSRMKSFAELKNIENADTAGGDAGAMYSNNPGGGSGGVCYGDSGGPQFYQDTNTIVSITSWGVTPCIGVDYSFRIDTADALDFINDYL